MTPREFAIQIAKQLQEAGYTAFWAGGCVRDQLLGHDPKDYDVATNARPEEVQDLFGRRRTLAIGAAFGVITVLGPRSAGQVEVATFRRDAGYSDGRRPDAVEYTDAREDASRRDFTINGMFFDPVAEKVVDFVGGEQDLKEGIVRAIGSAHDRIEEDKLRMLRAVRFAATFEFELEKATGDAIRQHAAEITVVSAERIGAELYRMLTDQNRTRAVKLLIETGLLELVLPTVPDGSTLRDYEYWDDRLKVLDRLHTCRFETVVAALFWPVFQAWHKEALKRAWKLSNDQQRGIEWICLNWKALQTADQEKWSLIQPLLIDKNSSSALDLAEAEQGGAMPGTDFCRQRLSWPDSKLNPEPLIGGRELIELGIAPGPMYSKILQDIRDRQLDGEIESADDAVKIAKQLIEETGGP